MLTGPACPNFNKSSQKILINTLQPMEKSIE